jgi:hypothetical protein
MTHSSKKILLAYGVVAVAFIIVLHTSVSIPCIFRLLFDIPCPACGLTGAFILISRLDFLSAFRHNILTLPLLVGGAVYFVCALIDLFANKRTIQRFNAVLANKWVIAAAALLMIASWYYNFIRW